MTAQIEKLGASMVMRAGLVFLLMVAAAAGTAAVKPRIADPDPAPDLDAMLPEAFADWRRVDLSEAVLPAEAELGPGEAVAYRAYQDTAGRTITLVAAYGPPLGDSVRLHRPENCYVAQGFAVLDRSIKQLDKFGNVIPVIRLDTENSLRKEAVAYWLRDGQSYISSPSEHGFLDLQRGTDGGADGALLRISSNGEGNTATAFHSRFLTDFLDALSPEALRLLTVTKPRKAVAG